MDINKANVDLSRHKTDQFWFTNEKYSYEDFWGRGSENCSIFSLSWALFHLVTCFSHINTQPQGTVSMK